jgi:nucleoside-diphosphate-sugar epimerase
MRIAVTGATGFVGRHLVAHLLHAGHACRCWYRPASDRRGFPTSDQLEWVVGQLEDERSSVELVDGCQAVIHAALDRPGEGFLGAEGDVVEFVQRNVVGTIRLIEAARRAGVERFVFISTCAVHEQILEDRPLDEAHPLWPRTHYGAHKAAIEKFVHSYGLGEGYSICALRPTGIYGIDRPLARSKWCRLVRTVLRGDSVECHRGGKEVHVTDVARAATLLLDAPQVAGQAFNCYDRYVSEYEVAETAAELAGVSISIQGERTRPKHEIHTEKIRQLGMEFGGTPLLRSTIGEMIQQIQNR